MASNNRQPKPSRLEHHCEISSPVLRLQQVDERGMVMESRESFEIGATIELGFHVKYRLPATGASQNRPERNEFISGQALVVGCRFCASNDGSPVYEVTLLFVAMSPRDRRALRRFRDLEGRSKTPLEMQAASDEDPVAAGLSGNGANWGLN